MVGDHHRYICKYEILVDFNLVVAMQTAKPPNLIPCPFFQPYGTMCVHGIMYEHVWGWCMCVCVHVYVVFACERLC